jgi:hypothetical protein
MLELSFAVERHFLVYLLQYVYMSVPLSDTCLFIELHLIWYIL